MNDTCFFISDLHGHLDRYESLFLKVKEEKPAIVLMGGDILPNWYRYDGDFIHDYFLPELRDLKAELQEDYPVWMLILGNDDPRNTEEDLMKAEEEGLLIYLHGRKHSINDYTFYGYAFIPPTPFMLKDWEKYDVGVFVDPGCIHPTEGYRSVPAEKNLSYTNIALELAELTKEQDLSKSIFLMHSPPYKSKLDRAALDGQMVEYVPLDVHIGSIAIQRFIESKQPLLTLHGHVHESSSITGSWRDRFDRTHSFNAAWKGKELALIRFRLSDLENASRTLI